MNRLMLISDIVVLQCEISLFKCNFRAHGWSWWVWDDNISSERLKCYSSNFNKPFDFPSEIKSVDIVRKIAQQWRTLSAEQKQVFSKLKCSRVFTGCLFKLLKCFEWRHCSKTMVSSDKSSLIPSDLSSVFIESLYICVLSVCCRDLCFAWLLSPVQPFEEASLRAREQFKVDLQRYNAQLTPTQIQQQALEKRQRMAKRKALRKKRVGKIGHMEEGNDSFETDFSMCSQKNIVCACVFSPGVD